jgi:hypothetical protein
LLSDPAPSAGRLAQGDARTGLKEPVLACFPTQRRLFDGGAAQGLRMATRGPRGGPLLRGRAGNHRRVVRGGSFNNNRRDVRCAYRNRNDPDNLNRNQGFRPVAAHAFPDCRNCPAGTTVKVVCPSGPRLEKRRGLFPAAR